MKVTDTNVVYFPEWWLSYLAIVELLLIIALGADQCMRLDDTLGTAEE